MVPIIRKKILIKGVVQGVGFRPHVYKLALARRLSGWVKNDASGVVIEVQGPGEKIPLFLRDIENQKPPASQIDSLSSLARPVIREKGFRILSSGGRAKAGARIPADLALCQDCRRELLDPSDRRYLYPFINCTNCGPRFTIVKKIPYDRPLTTMKDFKMCPECLAEYRDPLDRRFHAQPNACPVCGPALAAYYKGSRVTGRKALELAVRCLRDGKIAALQSLGGFHLACDAADRQAVMRLRRLKDRPDKPFAVMTDTSARAEEFCVLSDGERRALISPSAPVVMLRKKARKVPELVAPGLSTVGVLLAYTPLHAALFKLLRDSGFQGPLVMTSGNRRDEPISKDYAAAREYLGGVADVILFHDREIHSRVDDSVGFYAAGAFRLVRRARGCVPDSIKLDAAGEQEILGCGADLKSAFCLTLGRDAFLSQHIGDQSEHDNQRFYAETLTKTRALLRTDPGIIAHDMHPDYFSSSYARSLRGVKVPVQHHVAHVLSVAAENSLKSPFIGVALDGTGYGTDGNIWGSEFLVVKNNTWRRAAHLRYFPLPGGDAAVEEVWRSALSLLRVSAGPSWRGKFSSLLNCLDARSLRTVERMVEEGINSPLTSSMGRLFDAVSFIAGLGKRATYEGQGPMKLESLCRRPRSGGYRFDLVKEDGMILIDPSRVVLGAARERGPDRARAIAEKFHAGLAEMIVNTVSALSRDTGIRTVALSGGVFQNRTLLSLSMERLGRAGFKIFANEKVPSNDGGVALGQVYYALKGFRHVK